MGLLAIVVYGDGTLTVGGGEKKVRGGVLESVSDMKVSFEELLLLLPTVENDSRGGKPDRPALDPDAVLRPSCWLVPGESRGVATGANEGEGLVLFKVSEDGETDGDGRLVDWTVVGVPRGVVALGKLKVKADCLSMRFSFCSLLKSSRSRSFSEAWEVLRPSKPSSTVACFSDRRGEESSFQEPSTSSSSTRSRGVASSRRMSLLRDEIRAIGVRGYGSGLTCLSVICRSWSIEASNFLAERSPCGLAVEVADDDADGHWTLKCKLF